jgi:hypothetical protein
LLRERTGGLAADAIAAAARRTFDPLVDELLKDVRRTALRRLTHRPRSAGILFLYADHVLEARSRILYMDRISAAGIILVTLTAVGVAKRRRSSPRLRKPREFTQRTPASHPQLIGNP